MRSRARARSQNLPSCGIVPTRIRHAVPADADVLAAVGARTFSDTFLPDNKREDVETYVASAFGGARQLAELRNPDVTTLLMESDDAAGVYSPIGYAQIHDVAAPECVTGRAPIELARFYLDRAYHGQGLAGRFMGAVLRVAEERGAHTMWLGVWEHNPRAIAFYRKQGFIDVGSHVFMLGSDPQTDRIMSRPVVIRPERAHG
jgi:GNAT superfamily N-acetyltransferase